MDGILAIDQGTTSTKGIIFTTTGEIITTSRAPLHQIYPEDGWVEQDPNEIISSVLSVMTDCYKRSKEQGIVGQIFRKASL